MTTQEQEKKQLPATTDALTAYPALSNCEMHDGSLQINSFPAIVEFAKMAVGCGFFEDTKTANQAIIKVSWGTSVGLTPMESINDVYVNRGKFGVWAKAIARKIKSHPRYDYKVRENTVKQCVLECYIDGELQNDLITYTMEQAIAAGVTGNKPWKVTPARMLFYKAITEAQIVHFPDVFKGTVMSTEDIQDMEFSEAYKKDRPNIVKQAQLEAAQDRAADKILTSKQLDEALDVTEAEEVPFDDGKEISRERSPIFPQPKPEFQDRQEGRARVLEQEGEKEAAEKLRQEMAEHEKLKASVKAVKWSDVILKATRSKYGAPQIKAWLEARGVNCADAANIPQAQLQAALAEMEPK